MASYRSPFFKGLSDVFEELRIVFAQSHLAGDTHIQNSGVTTEQLEFTRILPSKKTIIRLLKLIREVDLVVVPGSIRPWSYLITILCRICRKKTAVWLIGHMPDEPLLKKILRVPFFIFAEKIIFYSRYEQYLYSILFKRYALKFCFFKNWAPPDIGDDPGFKVGLNLSSPIVLCYIGRIHKKSRLDLLFRAMALKDFEAIIIGDGTELKNFKILASKLGIEEKVRWIGPLYEIHEIVKILDEKVTALIYPGAIGLSGNTAVKLGIPIVTYGKIASQAPEYMSIPEPYCFTFDDFHPVSLNLAIERLIEKLREQSSDRIAMMDRIDCSEVSLDDSIQSFVSALKSR